MKVVLQCYGCKTSVAKFIQLLTKGQINEVTCLCFVCDICIMLMLEEETVWLLMYFEMRPNGIFVEMLQWCQGTD
jgi:hypothetical protein